MSIVLSTLSIDNNKHGSVKPSAWDYSRNVQSFFGVTGEFHLHGRLHGRELTAWYWPRGYATHVLLHDHIETINALSGTSGTMIWTDGSDIKNFTNSVFNGFEPEEDPWYDGSGVNGWQVLGQLRFRQIKQ